MDVGAVDAISASVDARRAGQALAARPDVEAGVGFDAALARAQPSPPAAPGGAAGSVDGLVGTTVSPPPGGCMCDAMAASVMPPQATGATARATLPVQVSPFSIQAGDILSIDTGTEGERLHLAIVTSALEMLTPGTDGVVRSVPIPWSQVRDARRVL